MSWLSVHHTRLLTLTWDHPATGRGRWRLDTITFSFPCALIAVAIGKCIIPGWNPVLRCSIRGDRRSVGCAFRRCSFHHFPKSCGLRVLTAFHLWPCRCFALGRVFCGMGNAWKCHRWCSVRVWIVSGTYRLHACTAFWQSAWVVPSRRWSQTFAIHGTTWTNPHLELVDPLLVTLNQMDLTGPRSGHLLRSFWCLGLYRLPHGDRPTSVISLGKDGDNPSLPLHGAVVPVVSRVSAW